MPADQGAADGHTHVVNNGKRDLTLDELALMQPGMDRLMAEVGARTHRLYYAAQVGVRPARIAIQVNDRKLIVRDWAYHLENRLREEYGLEGVPVVIDFVPHSGNRRGG